MTTEHGRYWTDINRLFEMHGHGGGKGKLSRLGVSIRSSDVAAFHFAYGHF
jgi:hypothetical protein